MVKVEFEGVMVGYGDNVVVRDISFSVSSGEVWAILGRNGSGKSTLLKSVVSDIPLMSGQILVDGNSLHSLSRRHRACCVSIVEQELPDSEISVSQYVRMGLTPHKSLFDVVDSNGDRLMVDEVMRRVGIEHLALKRINAISGGERRLCMLARVLLQSTPVVLLDEPTANLDIHNQQMVIDVVRSMASEGKPVICIVHDINEALRIADNFVVLDEGKVSFCGRPCDGFEEAVSRAMKKKILLREVEGRLIAIY